MILGTSIGAGMLALPIVSAGQSWYDTVLMLVFSWLLMTLGAFNLLEVNLWLKDGSNMLTMAQQTLGKVGKYVCLVVYIALLLALICAYLSGAGDVLHVMLQYGGLSLSRSWSTFLIWIVLSTVVYSGISIVDKANRFLMAGKLLAYLLLVGMIFPFVHLHYYTKVGHHLYFHALMVMITSFGYAIIVPSLRSYLNSDVRTLKSVILIGSLLPFVLYLVWIFVVQGVLPPFGSSGLVALNHSTEMNSALMNGLSAVTSNGFLSIIAKLFISICVITSFLGVSLCLFDFVVDALGKSEAGPARKFLALTSFFPPLFIVLFKPGVFMVALGYAGICCVILLIMLPGLMVYRGRYLQLRQGEKVSPGGKITVILSILVAVVFLVMTIAERFH